MYKHAIEILKDEKEHCGRGVRQLLTRKKKDPKEFRWRGKEMLTDYRQRHADCIAAIKLLKKEKDTK